MRTNRYQLKASTTILLSTLFNLHILCIYSLLSVSSVLVLIPSHGDLESIQGCHLIWWEKQSAACYPHRFKLEPRSWIYMGLFFFPFHMYFFFSHVSFSLFSLKHLKMSVRRRMEKKEFKMCFILHTWRQVEKCIVWLSSFWTEIYLWKAKDPTVQANLPVQFSKECKTHWNQGRASDRKT